MKVLQINAVSAYGSTGRNVVEIAEYLNNNGHEGLIAVSEGTLYKNTYKIGTRMETKLHGLFSRVFGIQAYFSKGGTKRLIKYMTKVKPNVVHLNNLHSNFINLKMLINYLATNDIPTVVTLHDCWFYTGKCCHYTVDNCFKWKTGCGDCPRLKKDNQSWFFDRTHKMWKDKKELFESIPRLAVVGVSDWITNEAKNSYLLSAKIIKRIYNWVDVEIFKPVPSYKIRKKYGLSDKFVILGVASDWNYGKGLDKFVELSNSLSEEYRIVLVGDQPLKMDYSSKIITITKVQSINELAEFYSMADVFITLSKEESFGKVSAEALACGTPIVAYCSTANPELVGDGCGFIIDKYDINVLLDTIVKIKEHGKKFFTKNCIAFARANFNKDDRILDYINVYDDIIKDGDF